MRTRALAMLTLLAFAALGVAAEKEYKLLKTVPVPGEGGWDYLTVDDVGRRVYVSHGTQVDVLDADSYEIKGTIDGLKGVHGIAVASKLGKGYISDGRADAVIIFDLKSLKKLGDVSTGKNPDCIIFEPTTSQVFAFNGRGNSVTVIDAAEGKATGTIELGGKPEFAVADGAGNVFVNLEDKETLVKIDAKGQKVMDRWPLKPGEEPSSMAMDTKKHRIFVGCNNELMLVVDSQNGKIVAKAPIGKGVDASAFDPETKCAFCSCGDGTLTVVHDEGDDNYKVVQTLKTKPRSKTMALDPKTHNIFLASAEFKAAEGGGRPSIVPKSFAILVYGK